MVSLGLYIPSPYTANTRSSKEYNILVDRGQTMMALAAEADAREGTMLEMCLGQSWCLGKLPIELVLAGF